MNAAEYGPVTITQSVSFVGPHSGSAKISVPSGGTGLAITTGAGAAVNLSGIEIVGGRRGGPADNDTRVRTFYRTGVDKRIC